MRCLALLLYERLIMGRLALTRSVAFCDHRTNLVDASRLLGESRLVEHGQVVGSIEIISRGEIDNSLRILFGACLGRKPVVGLWLR